MAIWQSSAIGGKFASRLFARFLLAAAIPIAAVAGLSYLYTSDVVHGQAHERLHRAASTYGHGVYNRLLLAQNQIRMIEAAAGGTQPLQSQALRIVVQSPFSASPRALIGDPESLPRDLPIPQVKTDPPGIYLHYGDDSLQPRIYLVLEASSSDDLIIGEIDPDYLFGSVQEWPYATRYCVFPAGESRPVFCPGDERSAPKLANRIDAAEANGSPVTLEWGGERNWAVAWDLFLRGGFSSPDWRIVALQPESEVLAPVSAFAWIFPPAVVLALFTAGLIGANQIRRMDRPLQSLRDGVQEIAAGRFQSRLQVDSADEFEELARAFNRMAEQLGRQFHALETLSEVDRRILASDGADAVVNAVMTRVGQVIHSDFVAVIIPDWDLPSRGRLFFVDRQQPDEVSQVSIRLDTGPYDGPDLTPTEEPFTIGATNHAGYLQPLVETDAHVFVNVPAGDEEHLWAYLFLGYRSLAANPGQDMSEARPVAARLAVALAAAYRTQQLIHQAHYDALTSLPNRQLLAERLQAEIARSERTQCPFAVLFIDLDHFKRLNDTMGHSLGDKLLLGVSERLTERLRETDTAARWGGDEFVIIAPGIDDRADASKLANNLLVSLTRPFTIEGREYHVGASIGIAVYPEDGDSPEHLLQNADSALYKAKETGRGGSIFFERSINEAALRRAELEHAMRRAVTSDEFHLLYQPQIRLVDGSVEGLEALLRWRNPHGGQRLGPAEFVPILEDIGAIDSVGAWVLTQACSQIHRDLDEGRGSCSVSVNVSARQFWSMEFADTVRHVLDTTGIPPHLLELEITEGMLLANLDDAARILDQLRAMGVRIALDDFGTGYSSLSYLRQLPVDTVKIDRLFVKDIEHSPEALTIVETIINMVHALGRRVVAEGVETHKQLELLTERNCDLGQGFLFAAPLEISSLEAYLRSHSSSHDDHSAD